jgi:hypothetical protein
MNRHDEIGISLRENLSGLEVTRIMQAEMMEKITGGVKVKKKLTVGLVFALCLMLAAVGALAVTLLWKDTAEQIAPLEGQHGYYDTWNADAKAALIRMLDDAGELKDSDAVRKVLSENLDDDTLNRLSDEIMTAYVNGTVDTVTLESILFQLHGDFSTWSDEDKAWYEELLKQNDLLGDHSGYSIPEGEEVSRSQAFDIAATFFEGLGITGLDPSKAEATFTEQDVDYWYGETQVSRTGHRSWSIVWPGGDNTVQIDIDADGTVSGYSIPELRKLHLAGSIPVEGDISAAQSVERAQEAVAETFGIAASSVAEMPAKAMAAYVDLKQPEDAPIHLGERLWYVNINSTYEVLVNQNSEIISCTKVK